MLINVCSSDENLTTRVKENILADKRLGGEKNLSKFRQIINRA
jgi:hypothetical protein